MSLQKLRLKLRTTQNQKPVEPNKIEEPASPPARTTVRRGANAKFAATLASLLTDEDLEAVVQVYRRALTAESRFWVDEGKDPKTGRAKGYWKMVPDTKSQLAAANMIAAYKEGLPVQRQAVLVGKFQSLDETMEKLQASPEALKAIANLSGAGLALQIGGETIDAETIIQKSGGENDPDSTE